MNRFYWVMCHHLTNRYWATLEKYEEGTFMRLRSAPVAEFKIRQEARDFAEELNQMATS